MVSARYKGLCHCVVSNLQQAGKLLVDHLHGMGHRRFGWIGSLHGIGRMLGHKEAVIEALEARGLELENGCQWDMPEANRQNGHVAVAKMMRRTPINRPTAIICHNAMIARGAVNHLFQVGLKVPRDVSVAAIDMTQVCVEEPPHITSAAAPPEALGARAAQLIIERRDGRDRSLCEVILPSELAVRETTAAARGRRQRSRGA
jgi:LacI family transcriptional regulator